MAQPDYFFKILLTGNLGVGKTSLLCRFSAECCPCNATTIGVDFKMRTLGINNKRVKLQMWDTAGQERFRTITRLYYKGAQGIFLVYSITDRQSFTNIEKWFKDSMSYAPENAVRILIGHKNDLKDDRQVTMEEGKELAEKYGIKFCEASAKDMTNVEEILKILAIEMMNKVNEQDGSTVISLDTGKEIENKKSNCCF